MESEKIIAAFPGINAQTIISIWFIKLLKYRIVPHGLVIIQTHPVAFQLVINGA